MCWAHYSHQLGLVIVLSISEASHAASVCGKSSMFAIRLGFVNNLPWEPPEPCSVTLNSLVGCALCENLSCPGGRLGKLERKAGAVEVKDRGSRGSVQVTIKVLL